MGTTMDIVGDGFSVHVLGRPGPSGEPCLALMHDYIEGWYSTPDLKVESHARQTGDGNFQTPSDRVLYESRTVTAHILAYGRNRDEVVGWATRLNRTAGGLVTVTVHDGGASTWARGYCQLNFDAAHYEDAMPGTLTVVCDDPRRYGTAVRQGYASTSPEGLGGLVWSSDAPRGLAFPLGFGDVARSHSVCTVLNGGTATAYPVITFGGGNPADLRIADPSGRQLRYQGPNEAPVVFDCLSRTAACFGVDRTRYVSARGWPEVPPGGSLTLSVMNSGGGYIEVACRDTYI